jgi:hypothetical protein
MTTHNSMHAHAPAGTTQLSNCETVELRDVELRGTTVYTFFTLRIQYVIWGEFMALSDACCDQI